MNSRTCACQSLEYIKVLKQCAAERISRWGLAQVYDVLDWNPVCVVLSDCWGISDMIWFISLGKTTLVGWNPVIEFCSAPIWDVRWKFRKGVNVQMTFIFSIKKYFAQTLSLPYFFIHPALVFRFPSCPAWTLALWCLTHLYIFVFLIHWILLQWLILPDCRFFFFTGWGVFEKTGPFLWSFLLKLRKWSPPTLLRIKSYTFTTQLDFMYHRTLNLKIKKRHICDNQKALKHSCWVFCMFAIAY